MPLIHDLGYKNAQIKTKESIASRTIGQGQKKTSYKPDYVLYLGDDPCCVIDAKGTKETLDNWVHQCSSYCLSLNQDYSSDRNPVKYFVLCNGLATQLYHWDSNKPILSLGFADFQYGHAGFEKLRQFLSAKTIQVTVAPVEHKSQNVFLERPSSERARKLFSDCHKIIWQSEGCGPAPAFMEFVKLMFVKLWCDRKLRNDPATRDLFTDSNVTKLPATSVVFSLRWIKEREEEEANPVDTILFKNLRKDIEHNVLNRKKKRLFDAGEQIKLASHTIKQVVAKLESVDMFGIDEDLNGRLFETFLSATMRGRELGQFFTPRSVVKMMTRLADLQVDSKHQDRVLDACCGSGGFLIEALTIMRASIRQNMSLTTRQREDLMEKVANECLFGMDFGKDPPLARIARINMYLHGDGGSRIYYGDALDKDLMTQKDSDSEVQVDIDELKRQICAVDNPLRFDVALTNPPFSMTKKAANDFERRILEQYVLSKRTPEAKTLRASLRSSVMFIERYYDLLKPNGRLITVIDDTLLASDQEQFTSIRKFIREKFIIRAIISLPGDAFRRSGARVKTSVLLLEKKRNSSDVQPHCLGYFSNFIGVDDLTPRAHDTEIKEARAKAEAETNEILEGYKCFLKGTPLPVSSKCVLLTPVRIMERLDLKYCVDQTGRLATQWAAAQAEVVKLKDCVSLVDDTIVPSEHPDTVFSLLKVSYEGRCKVEKQQKGATIKTPLMRRVKEGQLIFSSIRATDGAIGIVPKEMDGGLVSATSYNVFECKFDYDAAYLWGVLRSHEIRADMQSMSQGSGRYTTYWPEVGEIEIPWLQEDARKETGNGLIAAWKMEREVTELHRRSMEQILALGVESDDSIRRWKASRAPS